MSTFAATILKQARNRSGFTQAELGKQAGVTQSVVSAYESGKRNPSFRTLERLVNAAGFDLNVALLALPKRTALSERLRLHRDELLQALNALGARNVRLFGSVARGDDHPGSDIDLLVDLREDAGLLTLARMGLEAERILGVPVDVIPADSMYSDVSSSALADAQPV